ncbi:hypothetical protein QBC37DRAFT_465677 [Rhypophila decipiens]|uniref:Heterokaryon incompatibility domain-containing protein n=1 Tax=Rhypophila decipiens TaxID=261697 RepID=A0AAN7B740_9PEZI|nr:hypothetical protein QBC37DRAFT_465677 [Rhypophila decipiens]
MTQLKPESFEIGDGGLICCELFLASLTPDTDTQSPIPYHALSYVWGSGSERRYIQVNGRSFQVTVNLHEALRCLQLPDHERIIWVDAVCINQKNPREQGHQVRQMGQIYKTAGLVIYWLGVQTDHTKFCLDALHAFQERVRDVTYEGWTWQQWRDLWQSWAVKRKHSDPSLEREGLRTLLHSPWFRRVWILQEVANSQFAEVLCGKLSVRAGLFALAPQLMGVQTEAHTQAVLDMMPGPFRRDSWFSESRDLYTLLEKFGSSEATDPRDLVYALLGLSSDASPHIQPDYEKNEQEVVQAVFPFLYHIDLNLQAKFCGPATLQDLCKRVSFFNEVALEVAAANEISGDCVTKFILSRSPRVNVRESTLEAAARNGAKRRILLIMLRQHLGQLTRSTTSMVKNTRESLVETAASNEPNGGRILEYLLRHPQGHFSVTEKVLFTAVRNRAKGRGLIQICFSSCGDELLPMLTQRLVEAAVENDSCGKDIISDFMERRGGPYKITDQIIRIAASSPVRGVRLLNTLMVNQEESDQSKILPVLDWVAKSNPYIPLFRQAVTVQDDDLKQALVMACRHSTKAVEILLEHGASANLEDLSFYDLSPSPLSSAVFAGQAETVRLLIRHGAFVNQRDMRGRTPLLLAAETGSLTIVQELLKCDRVDVNLADHQNALFGLFRMTVTSGRPDILEALLTHGLLRLSQSDVDLAMRWGARLGHLALVDIVIGKWGARVNSTTRHGWTALMRAAEFGHVAVVESLIDNWGADINAVNVIGKSRWTALLLAAEEGHSAVVDAIRKRDSMNFQ